MDREAALPDGWACCHEDSSGRNVPTAADVPSAPAQQAEYGSGCFPRRPEELHGVISALRREVITCREELDVLRECLAMAGYVREVAFQVQLHRRRFALARVKYPLTLRSRLDTVIDVRAIALAVGVLSGPTAIRSLREVSRAFNAPAADILGSLCPGHLYVAGGFEGTLALSSVERFDPEALAWEAVPPMVEARQYTCSGVAEGRIFVCGGWGGPQPVSTVECLNPITGTWEAMPPMLVARWGAAAGVVAGRLHICGGLDERRQPLSSVERLEVVDLRLSANDGARVANGSSGPDPGPGVVWMPVPAMSERRGWPAAGALGGLLYVCGGRDEQREPLSSAERLNVATGAWEALPPMGEQRAGAAAAAAAGQFYVCGGAFGAQMLSSAERFDAKAHAWELLPNMASRRAYVAAASVGGCLLVFGGNDGVQCLSSAEQFNPSRGVWTPLPPMAERRSGAAATVLRS
eukprot:TRINITY_DN16125_c0_g1_i1.p1 TRINITY_DN16125_c0_g1~~TRINITY_DN16125_c0_g1_i1.p1  ORF type:complete len:465 (-),score=91.56 TRINITY_DN16125_c0_g1_i1:54-1448(-)